MVVTPDSPFSTAHCTGAAPRYFGSSEACTLTQPYFGISRISFGRICPNAVTTITSGASARISAFSASSFRIRSGVATRIP